MMVALYDIGFAQADVTDVRKLIRKSNELWFEALAKNDPSTFEARYTEDCWIMPADAPALCGPQAAKENFETMYNDHDIRGGKFITIDLFGVGTDIIAEVGFRQLYNSKKVMIDDGKYIVLWKRTPEGWKIFRESYNSSRNLK